MIFEHKLDRITCATLLTEAIKYLIFQRYQIPLPFDQLKAEDERERRSEEGKLPKGQASRPSSLAVKKSRQLIAGVEELLGRLYHVFIQVQVFDVLLLLGSTVVNPKEIYSIRFLNVGKVTEADRLKAISLSGKENGLATRSKFVDKCCRKLARMLFTDPNLNECGELQCTSINCFILAPRDAGIDWFKPKASFKVPKKGKCYFINVSESKTTTEDRDVQGEEVQEDTMWFQAPTVLKGYKEMYKETVESSIWGK